MVLQLRLNFMQGFIYTYIANVIAAIIKTSNCSNFLPGTMLLVWIVLTVQIVQCYGLRSNNCGFNSMCTCSPDQYDLSARTIHSVSCLLVPFYKFPSKQKLYVLRKPGSVKRTHQLFGQNSADEFAVPRKVRSIRFTFVKFQIGIGRCVVQLFATKIVTFL